MRYTLAVILDPQGIPCAEIPLTCMWDLVEYLSIQRVAATYEYHASHFKVTFTRLDLPSAQHILNQWSRLQAPEMQSA